MQSTLQRYAADPAAGALACSSNTSRSVSTTKQTLRPTGRLYDDVAAAGLTGVLTSSTAASTTPSTRSTKCAEWPRLAGQEPGRSSPGQSVCSIVDLAPRWQPHYWACPDSCTPATTGSRAASRCAAVRRPMGRAVLCRLPGRRCGQGQTPLRALVRRGSRRCRTVLTPGTGHASYSPSGSDQAGCAKAVSNGITGRGTRR